MPNGIICEVCQTPMARVEANHQFSDVAPSHGVSSTGTTQASIPDSSDYPGAHYEEEPETEIVDYECPECGARTQVLREI